MKVLPPTKRIGIIGGLSPESTVSYYLHLTRTHYQRYGCYPIISIISVDLERYHSWRNEGRWDLIAKGLIEAAKALERAGAEIGLIATNTMHKVFDDVQKEIRLPLLHILDATLNEVRRRNIRTVGLLGTRFTMGEAFYVEKIRRLGVGCIVPDGEAQELVHGIIEDELVRGQVREASRQVFLRIIGDMVGRGAEGIILGCTEIPLLIREQDCACPLLDTAVLHAEAALAAARG
ncbi:MAG TPA: amino acid racemase [Lacunisphaera sp.]|jgi:aspartate racemase|nr:amino acid racemase [Lacunisphaera sp.]